MPWFIPLNRKGGLQNYSDKKSKNYKWLERENRTDTKVAAVDLKLA
jgi:hypothetical protein